MGMWMAAPSMATPRFGHTTTVLPDGRILVAGGNSGSAASPVNVSTCEIYDPVAGTWSGTGALIQARRAHAAALTSAGLVIIAGGTNGAPLNTTEQFDPATGAWTSLSTMMEGRAGLAMVTLFDGRQLAVDGGSGLPTCETYSAPVLPPPPPGGGGSGATTKSSSGGGRNSLCLVFASPLESKPVLLLAALSLVALAWLFTRLIQAKR